MVKLAYLALALLSFAGCAREEVYEAQWPVMGTIGRVKWKGASAMQSADEVAQRTIQTFAEVEKLLNAHDPESELRRLAALTDAEILEKCNPLVRPCYEAAFKLRDETGGVFNPRWRGPCTMDLGAIAKGFAIDLAAEKIDSLHFLLDLGGNLKSVSGSWKVGVVNSDSTFALSAGEACATSAKYYRGEHIRDGRTGAAVSNAVYSVTVIHPSSAMLADGLSTVCFLLGRENAEQFLRTHYPTARAFWQSAVGAF